MKLFGFLQDNQKQGNEEERPPLQAQIREYIKTTRQKIKEKDRAFKVKAIIVLVLYIYLTGILASIFRYFGEMSNVGFRNAPKPTITPWGAIGAIFSFKYSLMAILLTLIITVAIILWWIRNHIGLGDYDIIERDGMNFKLQKKDAAAGSARPMTPEEEIENFAVIPQKSFKGKKNPGTIIFGRDINTGDYVLEKPIGELERPSRHTFTVGATGSFKTTNYIIPMIMQISRSGDNMIISGPAELVNFSYHMLKKRDYNIKVFDPKKADISDGWNIVGAAKDPVFSKIFAKMIVDHFAGAGKGGDPFWPEGMYVLFSACIQYVNTTTSNTIEQILYMLKVMKKEGMDKLFLNLPDNYPGKSDYETFLTSPVPNNVINGLALRLSTFNVPSVGKICSSEGIDIIKDLAEPGSKTAIFIVADEADSVFSFIPSLFLTAAVKQLKPYAEDTTEKTLAKPVHFIMDEFSNTGYIEDMPQYLATMRKYGIVFHLIIQNLPQFYKRYSEHEVNDMISNCEYKLIFGIGETVTAEFFEKYCGITTIRSSMTQSSSVVTKSTENFREGEQKRNLYNADEFIVMNERNYVLLRKGRHPLELEKVYWKNLEDSKLFKPFERADYVPVSSSYKPVTRLKTSDNASKIGIDYNKGADGANTFDGGRQFGIYEEQTPTFRKEEKNQTEGKNKGRNKGNGKGKGKKKEETESPPLFEPDYYPSYYLDRPIANANDICTEIVDGKTIIKFKNNKNKKGQNRQAVILKYNIDGTKCKVVKGAVPDNMYVAVKTKIDLDVLETACTISKENSVFMGWKLTYKRGDKEIESKRIRDPKTNICVNEHGEITKSYSFSMPQSDCVLSPIFETAKGANKNTDFQTATHEVQSTENAVMRM